MLLHRYFPLIEDGPVVLDISAEGGFVEVFKGDVGIPILDVSLDDIQGFLGGNGPLVIDALLVDELVEAVEEVGGRFCLRSSVWICGVSLAAAHIALELLPKFFIRHLAVVIFIGIEVLFKISQGLVDFKGGFLLPVFLPGLDFSLDRIPILRLDAVSR